MSRGRSGGPFDDVFEAFKEVPFPVALVGAAVLFALLYFGVPALVPATGIWALLGTALSRSLAPLLSAVALLGGLIGVIERASWRRLFNRQMGLQSIRAESWQDFEPLIAEAYRRRGYQVTMRGGPSADGGVDLELQGAAGRVIVQCKQWKSMSVGVAAVRALFGVMMHEHADRAILVTSGSFTNAAKEFAVGKPLELVDGVALDRLIRRAHIQLSGPVARPVSAAPASPEVPFCPTCEKPMVRRTAGKGRFAGEPFWGCSDYPSCKGIRRAV